ncbi:ABC transporter permease [Devosia sp.]|uniref:ABC transporter permease n=1 Tax=Devosia sp. TaxID=1871048 RepID=UPI003BAD0C6F
MSYAEPLREPQPLAPAVEPAHFDSAPATALERLRHLLHDYPTIVPVLILLLSVVAFGLFAGDKFFAANNLSLVVQQVSIIGLLAAAQSLVVLTAGIDLSVAAIMVLASVISGKLAVSFGLPAPVAVVLGFAAGLACGWLNGMLITLWRMPPFIVTLGTWNVFFALNLLFSGAQSIRSQDLDKYAPLLKFWGERFDIAGATFTFGSLLTVTLFALLWYVLNHTAWGRHVYAVGDDKEAAELAGIRTNRVIRSVYVVAGLIAGLAAWASIGRVGSVSPQSFYDANLSSITAVVIGGISLFGGRGSIAGPLVGALIVGVFQSGLRIAGVDVLWQVFAIGWLIILAVGMDQWIRKVAT